MLLKQPISMRWSLSSFDPHPFACQTWLDIWDGKSISTIFSEFTRIGTIKTNRGAVLLFLAF